jgi:hypothetical protein
MRVQQIKCLEGAVLGLMEGDQDRQDLAEGQAAGALPAPLAAGQELALPSRQKRLAEIIHITEDSFEIDHGGSPGDQDGS